MDKVLLNIVSESEAIEGQRAVAPSLVADLRALDHAKALLLVRNSRKYQVWPLAEEFLKASREGWMEDARESERLAEIALHVASHIEVVGLRERLLNDLKAEAWAYIGNCRRIRSDLGSAEAAFRQAETFLKAGSRDQLEFARFQDLKASLFAERRDYQSATRLLTAAITVYQRLGESYLEGRALVKQAKFLYDNGAVDDSIAVTERASILVGAEKDPALYYYLKKNLVWYLAEVGRLSEARALMPEVRALARDHGGRLESLRFLWTEAMLRRKSGQLALAEEAFKQVREGFLTANIAYDVAQVSLDLAGLYLEQGRTDEVRRLAVETMPVFASLNVQRELMVAWSLFRQAADREAATFQLLQEVADTIRRLANSRQNVVHDLPA